VKTHCPNCQMPYSSGGHSYVCARCGFGSSSYLEGRGEGMVVEPGLYMARPNNRGQALGTITPSYEGGDIEMVDGKVPLRPLPDPYA
jgi:hypothetical protein